MKLHLSEEEKQFLYNKYHKEGLDKRVSLDRLKNIQRNCKKLIINDRNKKKSKDYIESNFKDNFLSLR